MHIERKEEIRTPLFPAGTKYCQRCGGYKEVLIVHKDGKTYCTRCQNKVMRDRLNK